MSNLTEDEKNVLAAFAKYHGRTWKADLRTVWMNSTEFHESRNGSILRAMRNKIGPSGLAKIKTRDLIAV